MSDAYRHVFSPIKIGPIEVKNRLYMPPHGIHATSAAGPNGSMVHSNDYAFYLAERAQGGVGLLNMSLTIFPRLRMPCPLYEESIPDFKAVADLVHKHGAKLMGQLHYAPNPMIPWEPLGAFVPIIGPSAYQTIEGFEAGHELSAAEIGEWVRVYGRCTRNLRDAGLDGVEIHVSHATLLNKFLSPYFNRRDDEYGGDFDGRLRMLIEVLHEVRANAGPGMAVGIRLNVDELIPGGLTQDDTKRVLERLVDLDLLDFADLDVAVEPEQTHLMTASMFQEPFHIAGFAAKVGAAVKGRIVVMAAGGRITSVAQAEALLAKGELDMIGVVRELIAEPDLIKHALEGREADSRTCISTSFCLRSAAMGRPGSWGCVINPATGRERRWGARTLVPKPTGRKVVVAGAGPAGLEAARVAAHLGHEVVLIERNQAIGGQLALWARLPKREILKTTIDWYGRQLEELGVKVRLGDAATTESILAEKPDAVIVATGSRYDRQGHSGFTTVAYGPIAGWDRPSVYSPEQILEDGVRPSGRVLILDDDRQMHTGIGIAELLAAAGADVEIVSRDFTPVGESALASFDHQYVIPRLLELGVTLTPMTHVREIGDGRATVFHVLTGVEAVREVDAVVLVSMRRSITALVAPLEGHVGQLYSIGDALGARSLFDATYEGQRFARLIGEDDAPRDTGTAILMAIPSPDAVPKPARTINA